MGYIALRSMKVQKADGSYEIRKPGQAIPEADTWPNPAVWEKRGYIQRSDGQPAPQGLDRSKLKPPRAATEADLAARHQPAPVVHDDEEESDEEIGEKHDEPAEPVVGEVTREQLSELKKTELLKLAGEIGLQLTHHKSKDEIISAILDAAPSAG